MKKKKHKTYLLKWYYNCKPIMTVKLNQLRSHSCVPHNMVQQRLQRVNRTLMFTLTSKTYMNVCIINPTYDGGVSLNRLYRLWLHRELFSFLTVSTVWKHWCRGRWAAAHGRPDRDKRRGMSLNWNAAASRGLRGRAPHLSLISGSSGATRGTRTKSHGRASAHKQTRHTP